MDLIRNTDTEYEEYETLLTERDQIRKDAESIWINYVNTFGQLITAVYEEKLECIKCKKIITYYQTALNYGGVVDSDAMQQFLDHEMASYYENLKKLQEEARQCSKAETATLYEVRQAKVMYHRLVKLLHPDINPATNQTEQLMELWLRVVTAFEHNDIKELSELEVLIQRALKGFREGTARIDIPDLKERIEAVKSEIYDIVHTEPYIYQELLKDSDAVNKKISELTEELESYRHYHKELDSVIQEMTEGGLKFQWRMR